jgi:glycine cleavage system H protein
MIDTIETKVDKFTFKVAIDRFYTNEGVWAFASGSSVRIGLSDFLQQSSGDIAFADVKAVGTVLAIGGAAAVIETIKVNIDFASPIAGTIVRVNALMETAPETINLDPYGEGWVCEIEAVDWESEQKNLVDPEAYFAWMKLEAENEVKKE